MKTIESPEKSVEKDPKEKLDLSVNEKIQESF